MAIPKDKQEQVDKLKTEFEASTDKKAKLRLAFDIGSELWLAAPPEAVTWLERSLALAEELGDVEQQAACLSRLCHSYNTHGDTDIARKAGERAVDLARECGSKRTEAAASNQLGNIAVQTGDHAAAVRHYEECRRLGEECGHTHAAASALAGLGTVRTRQGRLEEALEAFMAALELECSEGLTGYQAHGLYNIGFTLEQLGRWEEAAEYAYRAIATAEQDGDAASRYWTQNLLGELHLKRARPERAAEMFDAILTETPGDGLQHDIRIWALLNLGQARLELGDLAAAEHAYGEALALADRTDRKQDLSTASTRLAELALAQDESDRAEALLDDSIHIANELGLPHECGEALRVRARLHAAREETDEARAGFEAAIAEFEKLGDNWELCRARLQFAEWLLGRNGIEAAEELLRKVARTAHRLALVRESETANRFLFEIESARNRGYALLDALKGLSALALEAPDFLERALHLIVDGLRFDRGTIYVKDQVVVSFGTVETGPVACRMAKPHLTNTTAGTPVHAGDELVGHLCLARDSGTAERADFDTLRRAAEILAAPIARILRLDATRRADTIPGLVYAGVVGTDPRMLENLERAAKVAVTTVPVLVRGASGTGKELFARAIHDSSPRRERPFVAVNCAAVPGEMLEAEFFGVKKGAATGVAERKGRFELADKGTIFLDEIGDMSAALQAKLLRVLEEQKFERVGGERLVSVDVRVVAATNQDINDRIESGDFRQDLYYRLNTIEFELPPLRERPGDIAGLARYFVARSNDTFGLHIVGPDPEALELLKRHDWPGNVRELAHAIERAAILTGRGMLDPAHLPPAVTGNSRPKPRPVLHRAVHRRNRDDEQRTHLIQVLDGHDWNIKAAAQAAGYSRSGFYELMKRLDIRRPGQ